MQIPMLGPGEVDLDACGLMPASVGIDRNTVFGLDYLFREIGKTEVLRNGASILNSQPTPLTVNGITYAESSVVYIKDDCAVLDYNRKLGTGLLNIVVVRQDISDIVRPIPFIPNVPIPASVNGFDIVAKYQAVDDVMRATEFIVDPR